MPSTKVSVFRMYLVLSHPELCHRVSLSIQKEALALDRAALCLLPCDLDQSLPLPRFSRLQNKQMIMPNLCHGFGYFEGCVGKVLGMCGFFPKLW